MNQERKRPATAQSAAGLGTRRNVKVKPLRRVVARVSVPFGCESTLIPQDRLECGHMLPPVLDIFGERAPVKRRCWKRLRAPEQK